MSILSSGKTLRRSFSNKYENIKKHSKYYDSKYCHCNFNLQRDSKKMTNENTVIYCSDLEHKYELHELCECLNLNILNKNVSLEEIQNYLNSNSQKKIKKYMKNNSIVRYIYDMQMCWKVTFFNNTTTWEKYENPDANQCITYILDVYLYPDNKYTNDGVNKLSDQSRLSPCYFEFAHSKNSLGYGSAQKNTQTKKRHQLTCQLKEELNDYYDDQFIPINFHNEFDYQFNNELEYSSPESEINCVLSYLITRLENKIKDPTDVCNLDDLDDLFDLLEEKFMERDSLINAKNY